MNLNSDDDSDLPPVSHQQGIPLASAEKLAGRKILSATRRQYDDPAPAGGYAAGQTADGRRAGQVAAGLLSRGQASSVSEAVANASSVGGGAFGACAFGAGAPPAKHLGGGARLFGGVSLVGAGGGANPPSARDLFKGLGGGAATAPPGRGASASAPAQAASQPPPLLQDPSSKLRRLNATFDAFLQKQVVANPASDYVQAVEDYLKYAEKTRLAASLMMGAQGLENLLGRVPLGSGGTLHL